MGRDSPHTKLAFKAYLAMRAKSLILLVIALGCGMVAAVAVSKTVMEQDSGPAPEATVEIFVAVKDINTAQPVTADNVKLEKWPKSRQPEGAITKLEQLEGKFARQIIFADEPILEKKIQDSNESFSTNIPPGYRVFDISCNSSYIKAGDLVDITGTFKIKGSSTPEIRTVMRRVQVMGINGDTARDPESKSGKGAMFQLLIKESQLEALTLANKMGDLQLVLRPLSEDSERDSTDNGESFLSWLESTNEAPEPAPSEPKQTLTSLFTPQPTDADPEPKKQKMTIVTPNGVTTYEWSGSEIPQEVTEETASASKAPQYPSAPPNPWQTSGNVYSGYGGYTPTYPNGVPSQPNQPAQSPEAQDVGPDTPNTPVN